MNEKNNINEGEHLDPEKEKGGPLSEAADKKKSRALELNADSEPLAESSSGNVLTPAEEKQEDILFPLEPIEQKAIRRKKAGLSILRVFLLCALLAGTFLLGFGTQPEVLDKLVSDGKKWLNLGMEKAKPFGDMVYEKAEEMVDNIRSPKEAGHNQSPSGKEVKTDRKVKYWKAPMIPGFTSDRPGKSPMGMDLVPVYEDDAGSSGIFINPNMVQNIGVKTQVVEWRTLSRKIRTIGRLTYDERLIHHIHTKYGGWVDKLYVDFTGQKVNKDDVLLEIYSPELVTTQEELILALKYQESLKDSVFPEIVRGAKGLVDSTLKRLQLFDVPEHQIGALIKNRKVSKTMHVHSPVKGFVIEKNVQHGMHIQPGMNLYMIADLSNIWVIVDIYEYEIPWVKLGQEAEMSLSYFPGKTFKGKVTFINPILDSKSRTLKVRIEFSNPDGELKPEMYANVILKSAVTRKGVAVPEEAVIYAGASTRVLVQNSSGGFEARKLTLGVKTQGYVQVLKGLKAGERVVTSSNFLIDSESRLKEALEKMQSKNKPMPPTQILASSSKTKHEMKLNLKEAPMDHSEHKVN